MKNSKGFTLVELLVVMVIIGIVVGLSFPAIRTLQQKNAERKYTTYQNSLKSSAKLYVDSYDEDLFGRKENGCACIKYEELESKKLAKDITVKDISCDTGNTFVRVNKVGDTYTYDSFIGCKDKKTNSVSVIYPQQDTPHTMASAKCDTLCNDEISNGIAVAADPDRNTSYRKKHNTNIYIESVTGINQGVEIYYAWSTSNEIDEGLNYKRVRIKVPANQKERLSSNWQGEHIITAYSSLIYTPTGKSGSYYLHVRVDRLYDLYDASWQQENGEKYLIFGPFNIDNEPPVVNSKKIESLSPDYNSLTPNLKIDATDNITPKAKLKICAGVYKSIPNPNKPNSYLLRTYYLTGKYVGKNFNYCVGSYADNSSYISNYYVDYKAQYSLTEIDKYNTTYPVYYNVADEAGNSADFTENYKTAPRYTIKYSLDNGTHGSEHPETIIVGQTFTVSNPSKSVSATFNVGSTGASIDYKGSTFSKSGAKASYTFGGWNITGMDTSTHTYGNNTSNANKLDNVKETTFKNLRESTGEVSFSAGWNSLEATLPKITKQGYDCGWSTNSNGAKHINSGGKWTFSGATERTFTAECRPTIKCPTITAKVGEKSYTKNNWTNQDIKLTFAFGSDIVSYDWYLKKGSGEWTDKGNKNASITTQTLSAEGEWSVRLIIHDNWGATKTCDSSSYKIDKTAPQAVPINFSLDSTYGTGNRGTYDIPAGKDNGSGTTYGCTTTDFCGGTFVLSFRATDDATNNGVKSGIAYYEHSFKAKCYDPTNTRERGENLIGIGNNKIRCNLSGASPLYSIPPRTTKVTAFTIGKTQPLTGYYNGHAGYWPNEYSDNNGYIGMSVGVEIIVAVDNAGNRSSETYIKYKSCTLCKGKTKNYYHSDTSEAETKTP